LGAAKTAAKVVGGRDPRSANREPRLNTTVRSRINLDGAAELRKERSLPSSLPWSLPLRGQAELTDLLREWAKPGVFIS
jgi:hypothetical protein